LNKCYVIDKNSNKIEITTAKDVQIRDIQKKNTATVCKWENIYKILQKTTSGNTAISNFRVADEIKYSPVIDATRSDTSVVHFDGLTNGRVLNAQESVFTVHILESLGDFAAAEIFVHEATHEREYSTKTYKTPRRRWELANGLHTEKIEKNAYLNQLQFVNEIYNVYNKNPSSLSFKGDDAAQAITQMRTWLVSSYSHKLTDSALLEFSDTKWTPFYHGPYGSPIQSVEFGQESYIKRSEEGMPKE
jgi:hypothetical protein